MFLFANQVSFCIFAFDRGRTLAILWRFGWSQTWLQEQQRQRSQEKAKQTGNWRHRSSRISTITNCDSTESSRWGNEVDDSNNNNNNNNTNTETCLQFGPHPKHCWNSRATKSQASVSFFFPPAVVCKYRIRSAQLRQVYVRRSSTTRAHESFRAQVINSTNFTYVNPATVWLSTVWLQS